VLKIPSAASAAYFLAGTDGSHPEREHAYRHITSGHWIAAVLRLNLADR